MSQLYYCPVENHCRPRPGCGAGPFSGEEALRSGLMCPDCGLKLTHVDPRHSKALARTLMEQFVKRLAVQSGS